MAVCQRGQKSGRIEVWRQERGARERLGEGKSGRGLIEVGTRVVGVAKLRTSAHAHGKESGSGQGQDTAYVEAVHGGRIALLQQEI